MHTDNGKKQRIKKRNKQIIAQKQGLKGLISHIVILVIFPENLIDAFAL
jgi:hypothetical protein